MKPINAEEKGCNPISSNCVIWQGPDISCINLCKGDSVSDVVSKLAIELCGLIEQFKLQNFDFSCLLQSGGCDPKNFDELLQLIIDSICNNQNSGSALSQGSGTGNSVNVTIAPNFRYANSKGDTVTTMPINDYVYAIGNRVSDIVNEIDTVNKTLSNHNSRITRLENAKTPNPTYPTVTPVCVLPQTSTPVDVVVTELERQFCEISKSLGSAINIYSAISNVPPGLDVDNQLSGSGPMSSIPGWVATVSDLADSINNLWLVIADTRSAIKNIQVNCCSSTCSSVDITLTAAMDNAIADQLNVFFSGTVPIDFAECNPAGTLVTITDQSGTKAVYTISVLSNLNNSVGYAIDLTNTSLNSAEDLNLEMTLCLKHTDGTECQSFHEFLVVNNQICPVLSLTPDLDKIVYLFTWTGGATTFTTELYDNSGTVLLQSQTASTNSPTTVSNIFSGLLNGTQYKVRVKVTVNGNTTTCAFNPVTTLTPPCIPPNNVVANLKP